MQSIVTSSGQNDSGLFETNLHDERYLPFEYSGVISEWQLELPANPGNGDPCQFDYNTISDVILHLRYTAREGGEPLRQGAIANLKNRIDEAQAAGSMRLFSVRHEFPTEWAKFTSVDLKTTTTAGLSLTLLPQHYPFWAQDMLAKEPVQVKVYAVGLFAKMLPTNKNLDVNIYYNADLKAPDIKIDALNQNLSLGNLLTGNLVNIGKPGVITDATLPPLTLYFDDNKLEELWIDISWGKD